MPSHINDHTVEGNALAKSLVELHSKFDAFADLPEAFAQVKQTVADLQAAIPALVKLAGDVETLVAAIKPAVAAAPLSDGTKPPAA